MQKEHPYKENVARNIAREAAVTYFIFSCDINMYPSIDVIPKFLNMIARSGSVALNENNVYVLPAFDVLSRDIYPRTKQELNWLITDNQATKYQSDLCEECYTIPDARIWETNSAHRGNYRSNQRPTQRLV